MNKNHRIITLIVLHCTATLPNTSIASLQAGWRRQGWRRPGYHYVVDANGGIHQLLDTAHPSNGARGHNREAIHVAYVGGMRRRTDGTLRLDPADTRTEAQRRALRALVALLHADFPAARIVGHRDLSPDLNGNGRIEPCEYMKLCPCFDAGDEFRFPPQVWAASA